MQVRRKAETIMRQATENDGSITIEEFHVMAQKFPNILFPSFE